VTKASAAQLLLGAVILLGVSIYHALTTPWHPTDEQMIEAIMGAKAKPLKQSAQPLPALIWTA
jgi:hypothetical protein